MMDRITLGDDPWSDDLRERLRGSAHWATLEAWAAGASPTASSAYTKHLMRKWGLTREMAFKKQQAFAQLATVKTFVDEPLTRVRHGGRRFRGPICFRITNSGDLNIDDGTHRSVLLLHRGQPITGVVVERAPEWQRLRDDLQQRLKRDWGKKLYHPIPHPDFASWRALRQLSPELPVWGREIGARTVLDLGCHFGTVLASIKPEWGVGVGRDPLAHRVASVVLAKIGGQAVHTDILKYLREDRTRFDLVLALNVLHHLHKQAPEALSLVRERTDYVAVSVASPNERKSSQLPLQPLEYIRYALGGTLIAVGEYAERPLHLIRVNEVGS